MLELFCYLYSERLQKAKIKYTLVKKTQTYKQASSWLSSQKKLTAKITPQEISKSQTLRSWELLTKFLPHYFLFKNASFLYHKTKDREQLGVTQTHLHDLKLNQSYRVMAANFHSFEFTATVFKRNIIQQSSIKEICTIYQTKVTVHILAIYIYTARMKIFFNEIWY